MKNLQSSLKPHSKPLENWLTDVDQLQLALKVREARVDFWEYRKLINPRMVEGWWQIEIAEKLQQFHRDMVAGLAPVLIIQAPPQHGKSIQIVDFISWVSGLDPHLREIYTSFSERLGIRANLRLQRVYDTPIYQRIFPETKINRSNVVTVSGQYLRNREILEYVGHEGYFRNTTVRGSITGESLDLGVIDDPIKGREEANSETIRNKTWDWFTDDFYSRFSEMGALLCILTRWHIDDPIGRLIDSAPDNMTVLKYEAIATKDEKHRLEGEPLFPELKSLKFLLRRKKINNMMFEALYQQNPTLREGNVFKSATFRYYRTMRRYTQIVQSWDTAYKADQHNDYSVCTIWGVHDTGYDLLHVYRKKMLYPKLLKVAKELANDWSTRKHLYAGHQLFSILVEDKASGQSLIPDLRASSTFNVVAIDPEGDKLTRAHVVTPQYEAGKVFHKEGATWLEDYENELLLFDNGVDDDQVDSSTQFLAWISTPKSGTITDDFFDDD